MRVREKHGADAPRTGTTGERDARLPSRREQDNPERQERRRAPSFCLGVSEAFQAEDGEVVALLCALREVADIGEDVCGEHTH